MAAGRALWVLWPTEGRAGCRDRIEMCFFPKAIFKTQIPGTLHQSGQARQERSLPVLPKPPLPSAGIPRAALYPLNQEEKMGFQLIWGHLPRMAPFSCFFHPLRHRCAAHQAAPQTACGGRGRFQYYNRDHRPFQLHCYFPIQSS